MSVRPDVDPALLGALLLGESASEIETGIARLIVNAKSPAIRAGWQRAGMAFFHSAQGGRPPMPDTGALAEISHMVGSGMPEAMAISLVSRRMAQHSDPRSVAKRLRRKWAAQQNGTKQVLSQAS
jgi:hypothetical protein